MRILTCTPVAFGGGPDFFGRDSGLLCKGFQALGHSCKAVMPLPYGESDQTDDLIRTHAANLEDEHWWRELGPELVVLYAWGSPRYRNVARAIRRSGAFLVLNQDNGGLISPLAGWIPWATEQWILSGQAHRIRCWMRTLWRIVRGLGPGLLHIDPLRAEHLSYGHVIACVSPKAAESYRKLCQSYGGGDLVRRIHVVPHPVEGRFTPGFSAKRRQVACAGRWRDVVQKCPDLLLATIRRLLEIDPLVTVHIAGDGTEDFESWLRGLPDGSASRVRFLGRIGRSRLSELFRESQVFFSPSAFESFGIAAAEALCSGCSVVARRSVSMASFEWFVSRGSGRLSESADPMTMADAIRQELDAWDIGERDALRISSYWSGWFHADKVAARILDLREASLGGASVKELGAGH